MVYPALVVQSLLFRELRGGKHVVVQGAPGDEFFIILHGSVGITIADESQGETQVAVLGMGDHFGDLALMGPPGSPRRATVTCREECAFAVLHRTAYDQCAAPLFLAAPVSVCLYCCDWC